MKIILLVLTLLQTLLFSQIQNLEKVTLQFQWKYQYQFAGFIMAKELGYYEEEGLNVEFKEYNNDNNIIQDLNTKKVDYILSNSSIQYENRTLSQATLIATYFQRSPLIIVTQKDIHSILDLQQKK